LGRADFDCCAPRAYRNVNEILSADRALVRWRGGGFFPPGGGRGAFPADPPPRIRSGTSSIKGKHASVCPPPQRAPPRRQTPASPVSGGMRAPRPHGELCCNDILATPIKGKPVATSSAGCTPSRSQHVCY